MADTESGSRPSNGCSSFDPEDEVQAGKYRDLCRLITNARSRGEDFVCRGAKQIALLRWKDERKFKRIFGKERYPYTRQGFLYCLSFETYERWEQYLIFCKIHGFDPVREARKYGFGPPAEPIKRRSPDCSQPEPEPDSPSQ